jgi:hypothetical protein
MIDSIDQQRDRAQAAAEKLEKTVSSGFEAVVWEIGKQGERVTESAAELSNKVAAGLTAVVEEVGKQGREVAASSQRMEEICTRTVEKNVQELQIQRMNFDETTNSKLENIFQGMEKLQKGLDQAALGRYFREAWCKCFFLYSDPKGKDDIWAVDPEKSLGHMEDNLASFVSLGNLHDVDEVKRYCEGGASLEEVQDGVGEAGIRRCVWIDDRNSRLLAGSGSVRLRGELLTATELLRYLKKPVRKLQIYLFAWTGTFADILVALQIRQPTGCREAPYVRLLQFRFNTPRTNTVQPCFRLDPRGYLRSNGNSSISSDSGPSGRYLQTCMLSTLSSGSYFRKLNPFLDALTVCLC